VIAEQHGVPYIAALVGQAGQLGRVVFENHQDIEWVGGFNEIQRRQATNIGRESGCDTDEVVGIVTDEMGRTKIEGVYAVGSRPPCTPAYSVGDQQLRPILLPCHLGANSRCAIISSYANTQVHL
jgi:hypothetical protein